MKRKVIEGKYESKKKARADSESYDMSIEQFSDPNNPIQWGRFYFHIVDRTFLTTKYILPHVNAEELLRNANRLWFLVGRKQTDWASILNADEKTSTSAENWPLAMALITPTDKVVWIDLIDTFYEGHNFAKSLMELLGKQFGNLPVLPRDIDPEAKSYWVHMVPWLKNQIRGKEKIAKQLCKNWPSELYRSCFGVDSGSYSDWGDQADEEEDDDDDDGGADGSVGNTCDSEDE